MSNLKLLQGNSEKQEITQAEVEKLYQLGLQMQNAQKIKSSKLFCLALGICFALIVLSLSGCGSSGGAGGTPSVGGGILPTPTPLVHSYRYRVTGAGVNMSAVLYVNFGAATQVETPVGAHVVGVVAEDYDVGGTDTVAQFVNHSGGNLSITLYRDGVAMQVKSENQAGFSINFNQDI